MKRVIAALLAMLLLFGLIPVTAVSAAEKEIVLLAGSDFQVSYHDTSRIEKVLNTLAIHGIHKADGAFFCGDYTLNSVEENDNQSSYGISTLKQLFNPVVGDNMIFVQGNHDPEDTVGLSKAGNNDPPSRKYGVYVIHEDQYLQYNYDHSRDVAEKTAANLKTYLDGKAKSGWTKPIFVLSHVGLHWGNRTILQGSAVHGDLLVDVLNEAAAKGLNIIFLYGHNHSGGYDDFIGGGAVYFKKGDKIEVCTGQKKEHETRTIKFTYMNAGYIGYYSTGDNSTNTECDATVTMSVFRIRGDEVIIARYDGTADPDKKQYGVHNLKSKGAYSNYFFKENGYHVDLNTLVYTSARKVTATSDELVDVPIPTITTTTEKTYATTTKGSGIVVQKTTAGKVDGSTTKGQNAVVSTMSGNTAPTVGDTDPTDNIDEDDKTANDPTTGTEVDESQDGDVAPSDESVSSEINVIPQWVWVFPIVGGAVLVGSLVVLILTSRKKKAK